MRRAPKAERTKRMTIHLPVELIAQVHAIHFDPARTKPEYGALSRYIERLIRQDLDRMARSVQPKEK